MHLIIFDIDGTLIHSHDEEADCFERAFHHVTGIPSITRDLQSYQHVTDSGIAHECIVNHFQREPTTQELDAIEAQFLFHFTESLALTPTTAIAGAYDLLSAFSLQKDFCLAIATGSYHRSALLKLQHADLHFAIPLASCKDAVSRTKIMECAKEKAQITYNIPHFQSVTYLGDGPWDIHAVKTLQWKFIGIASNYPKEMLMNWGAELVVDNYLSTIDLLMTHIRKKG